MNVSLKSETNFAFTIKLLVVISFWKRKIVVVVDISKFEIFLYAFEPLHDARLNFINFQFKLMHRAFALFLFAPFLIHSLFAFLHIFEFHSKFITFSRVNSYHPCFANPLLNFVIWHAEIQSKCQIIISDISNFIFISWHFRRISYYSILLIILVSNHLFNEKLN